jgi:hypothetical protein
VNQKFRKDAQNRFLDDILANNPVTIKPDKIKKKRLQGPISRSKLYENGADEHSIPVGSPKKKLDSSGVQYAGSYGI